VTSESIKQLNPNWTSKLSSNSCKNHFKGQLGKETKPGLSWKGNRGDQKLTVAEGERRGRVKELRRGGGARRLRAGKRRRRRAMSSARARLSQRRASDSAAAPGVRSFGPRCTSSAVRRPALSVSATCPRRRSTTWEWSTGSSCLFATPYFSKIFF
jgi:hypothetical protein